LLVEIAQRIRPGHVSLQREDLMARTIARRLLRLTGVIGLLFTITWEFTAATVWAQNRLQVSSNGRYLQRQDGTPFFYAGDTAWALFHRLTREEADRYLQACEA
jgi:hypothetical protein